MANPPEIGILKTISERAKKLAADIINVPKRIADKREARREEEFARDPEKRERYENALREKAERAAARRESYDAKLGQAEDRGAAFMYAADRVGDKIADRLNAWRNFIEARVNADREWAERNKRRLLLGFAGFVGVAIILSLAYSHSIAYEYSYNGHKLGLVKNQDDVFKIVAIVSEELTKEYGAEINIDPDKDISFKKVRIGDNEVDDMEGVLKKLTYMRNINANACGIFVDGTRVAIADNENTANTVREGIKAQYLVPANESTVFEEVRITQNVELKTVQTKLGLIMDKEEIRAKLMTGGVDQRVHVVQAGETFSGISRQYGISQADLLAVNPDVRPEKLSIGQELILSQNAPLLTVQTTEVTTYERLLPYETTYENNANMFEGESSTKIAGVNGVERVQSRIVKNNGTQIAELVLDQEVLSEPQAAVVYVGTKKQPPRQGTGTFKYPVSGARLSSKFGSRWGRMHNGIDLACAKGTNIRASDGGTVTFSGYSGSYGYVVRIDHGGGYTTVYAHCSALYVSKGDKVYQGEHIADVGSTGNSTGPHCHFEIQYNGVPQNPLNYL